MLELFILHEKFRGIQHASGLWIQVRFGIVVHNVVGELRVVGMLAEEPSVRDGSISATVGRSYDRRYCLFLDSS